MLRDAVASPKHNLGLVVYNLNAAIGDSKLNDSQSAVTLAPYPA